MGTSEKLKVYMDIDATLTEGGEYLFLLNKVFQKDLKFEDIVEYDLCKYLGITHEEFREFYLKHAIGWHTGAKLRKGALDMLKRLRARGAEIYFYSARPPILTDFTVDFLTSSGVMEAAGGKEWNVKCFGSNSVKLSELSKLGSLDYAFDDYLPVLREVNSKKKYLLAMPYNELEYNELDSEDSEIVRVNNFDEIKVLTLQ